MSPARIWSSARFCKPLHVLPDELVRVACADLLEASDGALRGLDGFDRLARPAQRPPPSLSHAIAEVRVQLATDAQLADRLVEPLLLAVVSPR
jgi:hypothetical protein